MSGAAAGAIAVLSALRERPGEPISGEALSDRLGVSRAQVWKHVGALRKRGYAHRRRARRWLSPASSRRIACTPRRSAPGLATRWLARAYEHLETTDSTNRVAFDRGRAGAPAGTTIVAEEQIRGPRPARPLLLLPAA